MTTLNEQNVTELSHVIAAAVMATPGIAPINLPPARGWTARVLGNLRVGQKLTVLMALAMVLLFLPLMSFINTTQEAIGVARMEQSGIAPLINLMRVIQFTQQHRGLTANVLGGNQGIQAQRAAKEIEVHKAIDAMSIEVKSIQNKKLQAFWSEAVGKWNTLAEAVAAGSTPGKESIAAHTALVAQWLVIVDLVADHFGLSLDPQADSYHLMVASVLHLPNLAEVLGQTRATGSLQLAQKSITPEARVAMSALVQLVNLHYANMAREMAKALELNDTLRASLGGVARQSLEEAERAIKLAREHLIQAETPSFAGQEYYRIFTEVIDAQFKLNTAAMESLDGILRDRMVRLRVEQMLVLGIVLLISALVLWASVLIARSITRPLNRVVGLAEAVADGNLDNAIEAGAKDEIGDLLTAMNRMQESLRAQMQRDHERGEEERQRTLREQKIAAENLRIRNALGKCSTNVMIADHEGRIVYMNESTAAMLVGNEAEMKKSLPQFDASQIIGANFDIFHSNPSHQRNLLSSLSEPYRTRIKIGGLTLALTANPVLDEQGERVGTVLEWRDRTLEAVIEDEVAGIVSAANDGDFSKRLVVDGKVGFYKMLAEGINGLIETSESGMNEVVEVLRAIANGDFGKRVPTEGKNAYLLQLATEINALMNTSETGLNEVARVLGAIARGDLTEKIYNDYQGTFGQLKDDSNSTVDQLTTIINQIKDASDSIDTASKEISEGNLDLSQRTEEQACSLEQTASSLEDLTVTVRNNAQNASEAKQLAMGASEVAIKGGEVVRQVVETMNGISQSSNKIADIISVIDGIAFQTNILALNAAVEAARAGEQGRGFAVVASEVRNLAQRSAAAAKEIKDLISHSVGKVDAGSKLVDEAGRTMDEVVSSVARVTEIIASISAASQEQSGGIEQVNQAVMQMDDATQQNAALVEQAAAAAESLQEQTGNLVRVVGTFRLAGRMGTITKAIPIERASANRAASAAIDRRSPTLAPKAKFVRSR